MKSLPKSAILKLCEITDEKIGTETVVDEIIECDTEDLVILARAEGIRSFYPADHSEGYRFGGDIRYEDITITVLAVYERESGDEIELEEHEYQKQY
jgi:hypothetical protein